MRSDELEGAPGDADRPTLVYGFDPLCGWCFAFAEGVADLRRALGDEVDWEVACGGLVVGPRVAPIAEAADYLRAGMGAVEARTPARFGAGFLALLEEGTSLFLRVAGDGPEDLLVPVMAGWAPPEAALAAVRRALDETRPAG
ncbi:MAG TPA: hypothetical protein RMF84_17010 [Polyangiaceae bacterium LLY-WYZ-14_1]|nr:hypothetical protein [Polyangiaceae bacterium LLY-WYZ-14_1]